MRTSLYHVRSSTISQCKNAGTAFGKYDVDEYTINTIITQKYKKCTHPLGLPVWPAIAFDLLSCIAGFCSSQLAVCRSLESQAFNSAFPSCRLKE